jgi:hypothetical protein
VAWQPRWRSLTGRYFDWSETRNPSSRSTWSSSGDPSGCLTDILLLIGLAIVIALFSWIVLPLLVMVMDVAIVAVLMVATLGARILLRRPWTVEARASDGRGFTAHVVGWGAALRRRDELADRIRHGKRLAPRPPPYRRKVRHPSPSHGYGQS